MDQTIKNKFMEEYGQHNYSIINSYNLWDERCRYLEDLEYTIFCYLYDRNLITNSEKKLIDTFKLKNLSLSR